MAKSTIRPPKAGPVGNANGMGIISPDGEIFPVNNTYHSDWIVDNYNWLTQAKHLNLPDKDQLKRMEVSSVRDILVGLGWVPFFGTSKLVVYYKNIQSAAKLVLEAMQLRNIPKLPVDMINQHGEEDFFDNQELEEYVTRTSKNSSRVKISSRDR